MTMTDQLNVELDDPIVLDVQLSTSHYVGDDLVDDVAIDVALAGRRRVTLTPTEQLEACRRATSAGYTAAAIAKLLELSPRQVQRLRAGKRA